MAQYNFPIPIVEFALLFGIIFDLILFGILTAQVYIYYISFPKDRTLLKTAVVWVYFAGVAQTGLALLDLHISLTSGLLSFFAGGAVDSQSDHLWLSITALTGTVAVVIQALYAHRIYLISQKRWLAIMIMCMSLGQCVSSIIGAACYRQEEAISFTEFIPPEGLDMPIWGPINIACDLTITICMVTFLLRHRKRTMRHKTRSHITKVIQIIVETGMATTVLMIVYTVLFILWNTVDPKIIFPLPGLMMSKVYSNSMLVLLNNRATIVNKRNAAESFEFVEISARGVERDIELHTRNGNSTVRM